MHMPIEWQHRHPFLLLSVTSAEECVIALGVADATGQAGVYRLRSLAPIAQSVERLHGKEKVYGSIPYWGSDSRSLGTAVHISVTLMSTTRTGSGETGPNGGVAQVVRAHGS
jgi:hypothetical protein